MFARQAFKKTNVLSFLLSNSSNGAGNQFRFFSKNFNLKTVVIQFDVKQMSARERKVLHGKYDLCFEGWSYEQREAMYTNPDEDVRVDLEFIPGQEDDIKNALKGNILRVRHIELLPGLRVKVLLTQAFVLPCDPSKEAYKYRGNGFISTSTMDFFKAQIALAREMGIEVCAVVPCINFRAISLTQNQPGFEPKIVNSGEMQQSVYTLLDTLLVSRLVGSTLHPDLHLLAVETGNNVKDEARVNPKQGEQEYFELCKEVTQGLAGFATLSNYWAPRINVDAFKTLHSGYRLDIPTDAIFLPRGNRVVSSKGTDLGEKAFKQLQDFAIQIADPESELSFLSGLDSSHQSAMSRLQA